jgi:tRNA U34 5-methylaminomethyl-2-thiouridine-forming methyltransferase MnmC
MDFDSSKHKAIESEDGSFTAYSTEFEEHYHSTKDGALHESLSKHVLPALKHTHGKNEITVLDICFGLGFNTFATLYALRDSDKKINIYSPEFDKELIASLKHFKYPKDFEDFEAIVTAISEEGKYESDTLSITIYLGDARTFVHETDVKFDVVYQDAFSPKSNPALWTSEYFKDIASLMKEDAILTTYSIALPTRIALYENGLQVYLHKGDGFRASTLASKSDLDGYEKVDVEHKMRCNPEVSSLYDADL